MASSAMKKLHRLPGLITGPSAFGGANSVIILFFCEAVAFVARHDENTFEQTFLFALNPSHTFKSQVKSVTFRRKSVTFASQFQ